MLPNHTITAGRVLTRWRSNVSGSREVVLEVATSPMSGMIVSCYQVPEQLLNSFAVPSVCFLHGGYLRFIRLLIRVIMCRGTFSESVLEERFWHGCDVPIRVDRGNGSRSGPATRTLLTPPQHLFRSGSESRCTG